MDFLLALLVEELSQRHHENVSNELVSAAYIFYATMVEIDYLVDMTCQAELFYRGTNILCCLILRFGAYRHSLGIHRN